VNLQALPETPGGLRIEGLVKRTQMMGVEAIADPPDTFGRREILIHQQAPLLGKIGLGSAAE